MSLPDAGNWTVVIPLFDLDHNAGTVARIGMINRQEIAGQALVISTQVFYVITIDSRGPLTILMSVMR